MYGLRTVLPFVFGMSGFSQARFAALNLLGALVWSTSLGLAGYAFGGVMEIVLEDVSRYERDIAAAIFAVGTAILLYRRWRARRSGNRVRR
jgi:membrane protein DedA with SNARE-associated domain